VHEGQGTRVPFQAGADHSVTRNITIYGPNYKQAKTKETSGMGGAKRGNTSSKHSKLLVGRRKSRVQI